MVHLRQNVQTDSKWKKRKSLALFVLLKYVRAKLFFKHNALLSGTAHRGPPAGLPSTEAVSTARGEPGCCCGWRGCSRRRTGTNRSAECILGANCAVVAVVVTTALPDWWRVRVSPPGSIAWAAQGAGGARLGGQSNDGALRGPFHEHACREQL